MPMQCVCLAISLPSHQFILVYCLFEVLAGDPTYHISLTEEPYTPSIWDGHPLPPSVPLWEERTWSSKGRRGCLPSQPDQPINGVSDVTARSPSYPTLVY